MNNPKAEIDCRSCHYTCMGDIFSKKDLGSLHDNKSEMRFEEGDVILKQGTFISQDVYIRSGVIKIVLEGKHKNTILRFTDEGSYIALPVLNNCNKYPFSAIAITKSEVCFIRKETIQNIMLSNPKANKYLLQWYASDYLYMFDRIATISTKNNHGKLASALLLLSDGSLKNKLLHIISRKELAELAAISVESLNKILHQLKHDGIIELLGNRININRQDLLEELSTLG